MCKWKTAGKENCLSRWHCWPSLIERLPYWSKNVLYYRYTFEVGQIRFFFCLKNLIKLCEDHNLILFSQIWAILWGSRSNTYHTCNYVTITRIISLCIFFCFNISLFYCTCTYHCQITDMGHLQTPMLKR